MKFVTTLIALSLVLSSCITTQGGSTMQKPTVGITTLNPDADPKSGNNQLAQADVSKDPDNNLPHTNPPVHLPSSKSKVTGAELNSFEVTVRGQVDISKKCSIKANKVVVQLADGGDTVLGSSTLDAAKKFNIIATAPKGKLTVSVLDQARNNKVVYSREIFAGNNNQFDVNFILCLDKK